MTRYFGKICEKHPELNGERMKSNSACMGCKKERQHTRYLVRKEDPEFVEMKRKQAIEWARNNHDKKIATVVAWLKHKRHTDLIYLLKGRVRSRLNNAMVRLMTSRGKPTQAILGCNWTTLKSHIESKFTNGMSWDNRSSWHIDHIIPLSSASTEEELVKLCHYTNLQPLWALDNIRKSDKMPS